MKRLRVVSIVLFLLAAAGCMIYQIKKLQNEDKLGPLITMDKKILEVSVEDGEEKLMYGVAAADTKDGDVSSSLVIENLSKFLEKGRRLVTYAAFDSSHHVSKATREIVYTDYHEPQFYLEQPLRFPMGTTNLTEFMTVMDCLDGELTDKIKISPEKQITVDKSGEYPLKFQVANSAGDVVYLPVTVELYDNATYNDTPQISLSDYLVYTEKGKRINPKDYLKEVTVRGQEYQVTDGDETYAQEKLDITEIEQHTVHSKRINIMDNVDYSEPGTYEIIYSMISTSGNQGKVRLIVVVQDWDHEREEG